MPDPNGFPHSVNRIDPGLICGVFRPVNTPFCAGGGGINRVQALGFSAAHARNGEACGSAVFQASPINTEESCGASAGLAGGFSGAFNKAGFFDASPEVLLMKFKSDNRFDGLLKL